MHIKFLAHGQGSGQRAVDYLLGDLDHTGEARAGVRVLRGNPQHLADVIDSLNFVHRYTSGVIAWGPDDSPTEEQINALIDDFEIVAFAGLDAERYCWTVIEHRDEASGVHLHVLSARVDLETGHSLNIAPPGWQKSFDPLRDFYNFKYGWTRPDDPMRARILQPEFRAFKNAAAIKKGLVIEPDPRVVITDFLLNRIELGLIENREDILVSLLEIGEITRTGKNYISVKLEGCDRALRLKGAIYEEHFSAAAYRNIAAEKTTGSSADRSPDTARADAAYKEFQHAIKQRAEYNAERYQAKPAVSEQASSAAAIGSSRETARAGRQVQQLYVDQRFVPFLSNSCTRRGISLVPKIYCRADTAKHATSGHSAHTARTTAAKYVTELQHSDREQQSGRARSVVSSKSTTTTTDSAGKFSGKMVTNLGNKTINTNEVNKHAYRDSDSAFPENTANRAASQSTRNAFDRAFRAAERATAAIGRSIKHITAAISQRVRMKSLKPKNEALKLEHSSQQTESMLRSRSGLDL